VDDGAGALRRGEARYLLIRPETLAGVHRAVERAVGPQAAADCLLDGGRAGGARVAAALAGTAEERVRAVVEAGTALGWGRFALEALTPDGLVITVTHSPFAEAYGPAPGPVCHLIAGVLEAVATSVFRRPRAVREPACAAAGAPACRFESMNDGGDERPPHLPPGPRQPIRRVHSRRAGGRWPRRPPGRRQP
jgi:predicted hydrocarbon binding protein